MTMKYMQNSVCENARTFAKFCEIPQNFTVKMHGEFHVFHKEILYSAGSQKTPSVSTLVTTVPPQEHSQQTCVCVRINKSQKNFPLYYSKGKQTNALVSK
jgi:hypothetical protein